VGIQAVEYRLPEYRWYTGRDDGDARADRVALFEQLPDEGFQLRQPGRVRTEEGVRIRAGRVLRLKLERAHLRQVSIDSYTQALMQEFPRHGARRNAHHGLACRGTTAPAIVAESVLLLIGVVRMARTKAVLDLLVVARALVGILDQQPDRRAGGASFEDTRE